MGDMQIHDRAEPSYPPLLVDQLIVGTSLIALMTLISAVAEWTNASALLILSYAAIIAIAAVASRSATDAAGRRFLRTVVLVAAALATSLVWINTSSGGRTIQAIVILWCHSTIISLLSRRWVLNSVEN